MTTPVKGDRVSYTVSYGGTPGNPKFRTGFGRVTRIRLAGARQQPKATIAVENPEPGAARYVERYMADIALAPDNPMDPRYEYQLPGLPVTAPGVYLAEKSDRYRTVYGIFSTQDKAEQACQDAANTHFGVARTPPLQWLRNPAGYSSAPYDDPHGTYLFQVTRYTIDEVLDS